ncbi:MAG: hypothetical protein CVV06_08540 [Gammaproteobacteria bacterium HGW-Gammaproteobacteria-10]|nr:MAG: hypothetical protein CVV06_08540 [Gammaproteobacteria bacterium HGW-Gammaproteobacteria-10]
MEIKTEPFGQTVSSMAKDPSHKSEGPFGQKISELAQAKKAEISAAEAKTELNRSILQTSLDVSLSAGNEPMALLFKTALEGINDALKTDFGDNAIQKAYEDGVDISPEATAGRIVQMSTAFFERYHANHSDLSIEEALESFVELIGKGIDKGFGEARDILKGLNVLEGSIADNIDKTYDLVQEGLKAFVKNYQSAEK